jgi:hypothetical protein
MSAMPTFRVITSAKENEHEIYEIEADTYRLPEAGGFVVFQSRGKAVAHFLTTQLVGIVDKDSQEGE